MNVANQVWYVVSLLAIGALMGAVHDVYSTVTGASKWLRWLRPVLDLVFWMGSAGLVFYALLVTDAGRLRMHTFALLVVGYLLYRMTMHRTIVSSAFVIVRWLESLLRFVYAVIRVLILSPLQLVWKTTAMCAFGAYRLLCVVEGWLFWLVRFWLRVLMVERLFRRLGLQTMVSRFTPWWEEMWSWASKCLKRLLLRV